jgi:O-antigen/teichoic acid export membrane protein
MGIVTRLIDRAKTYRVLLFNSGSLLGTTAVTAGLGFLYWLAAAKFFAPTSVGLASAAVPAMMLLGQLGMMGLGTLLIAEMPRHPGKVPGLVATSLVISGAVSALIAVIFLLIVASVPRLTSQFGPLIADPGSIFLFCLGVVFTAVTTVLDQILIGMLRGGLQLWRNIVFAGSKLVILIIAGLVLSSATGMDIYVIWMLGNLLSLALVLAVAWRAGARLQGLQFQFGLMLRQARSALDHHILNLGIGASNLLMPIIVTTVLSVTWTASFYAAWMIIYLLLFIPAALTLALYAESAKGTEQLIQKTRVTLLLSFALGAAGCVVLFFGADILLGLFQATYAEQAAWCMRWLALSIFPQSLKIHYMTIYRVYGYIRFAAIYIIAGALLELSFSAVGAATGQLTGLGLAFLLASCLEGAYALPLIQRVVINRTLPAQFRVQVAGAD